MPTSLAPSTNFRENYFQHPELTKIIGEPTFESLTTPINELKSNAQSVHSTLGGGAHGHLGLVLTPTDYAVVAPMTPYVRPLFPGVFRLPANVTDTQAQILREQHRESLRQFQEVEAIHNALVQQVLKAVDDMYLKPLRNPITNGINVPLNQILEYLVRTYGALTPKQFQAKQQELQQFRYDIALPVDVVFTPIDDLAYMAHFARQPMSEENKIGLAYVIFQNSGKFKSDLKAWNNKPIADKTWSNMKAHFREALDNIRATDDTPIEESTYDQMNMVNEVLAGVKQIVTEQVQDQVQQILPLVYPNQPYQELPSQQPQMNLTPSFAPADVSVAPSLANTSVSTITQPPMQHYAFNVNAAPPPRVVQQPPPVQIMHPPPGPTYSPANISTIPVAPPHSAQGFSNFNSSQPRRGNRNRNKPRNNMQQMPPQMVMQQPQYPQYPQQYQQQQRQRTYLHGQQQTGIFRKNTSQYCWSHGACSHNGYACQQPKPGHVPWATFQNKCGGCTDFCT